MFWIRLHSEINWFLLWYKRFIGKLIPERIVTARVEYVLISNWHSNSRLCLILNSVESSVWNNTQKKLQRQPSPENTPTEPQILNTLNLEFKKPFGLEEKRLQQTTTIQLPRLNLRRWPWPGWLRIYTDNCNQFCFSTWQLQFSSALLHSSLVGVDSFPIQQQMHAA